MPLPALITLATAVVLWAVLRTTRYETRALAIGSLRLAAERAGLNVPWHLFSLALLYGVLAGLAGFVDLGHYTSTTVNGHTNDALAACWILRSELGFYAGAIGAARIELDRLEDAS